MAIGDHMGLLPIARPDRAAFWKRYIAGQQAW